MSIAWPSPARRPTLDILPKKNALAEAHSRKKAEVAGSAFSNANMSGASIMLALSMLPVLSVSPITERAFPNWSMGFIGKSREDEQLFGHIAGDFSDGRSCLLLGS